MVLFFDFMNRFKKRNVKKNKILATGYFKIHILYHLIQSLRYGYLDNNLQCNLLEIIERDNCIPSYLQAYAQQHLSCTTYEL